MDDGRAGRGLGHVQCTGRSGMWRCTVYGRDGNRGAIVWLDMLQRLLNEWDDKITPLSVAAN